MDFWKGRHLKGRVSLERWGFCSFSSLFPFKKNEHAFLCCISLSSTTLPLNKFLYNFCSLPLDLNSIILMPDHANIATRVYCGEYWEDSGISNLLNTEIGATPKGGFTVEKGGSRPWMKLWFQLISPSQNSICTWNPFWMY